MGVGPGALAALGLESRFKMRQKLELSAVDGRLEVEHATTPVRLKKRAGRLVAVADQSMPVLTQAIVRATLEQTRR